MKVETVKEIKLAYTVEECNALDRVATLLNTLIGTMDKEECDIISGIYYDETIDISKDDLIEVIKTISDIKYTTEMF